MWKEEVRYWKGTAGHWSPWGPILVGLGLNDHWIEVARGINNKGFIPWTLFGIFKKGNGFQLKNLSWAMNSPSRKKS